MPLRKTDDDDHHSTAIADSSNRPFPPEAYQYDGELKVEVVQALQKKADLRLSKEEWVVIDGIDKR
jgi:hypothetical protein